MLATSSLPPTLPPAAAVADLIPAAAKAIEAFHDFEATLPTRRSDEQLNQIDARRDEALAALAGPEFLEALAAEEAKLLSSLAGQAQRLQSGWLRLETISALRAWRAQPESFRLRPVACMSITLGNGYKQTVTGRELIMALADAIRRRR